MAHSNKIPRNMLHRYSFVVAVVIACFIIDPLIALKTFAQETQKPADTKKPAVQLSEKEWKALEGIFENAQNKEMHVEFTARENKLIAKLLWNNNQIELIPESTLTFISKEAGDEGPIHITFTKDSTGAINQVNVANNGVWNRTKDYKPIVKKEMDHTPEQLKPFEGLYQLTNGEDRFIQFLVKENNLVLKQHWDGNEISFVPETQMDFFSKEAPLFSLAFSKDNAGNISQVLAFKRDLWVKLKKVHPSVQQLKSYEGKYQSKDDPDNFIQLIAKENNLVVKQLWDGKETIVEPQTKTYFYNNSQSYPLQIIKDKDGTAMQVTILGMDLFNKVK